MLKKYTLQEIASGNLGIKKGKTRKAIIEPKVLTINVQVIIFFKVTFNSKMLVFFNP